MKSNINIFNIRYSEGQAITSVVYNSLSWGEETMLFWLQKIGKNRISISGKSILFIWSEDLVSVCLPCMGDEPKNARKMLCFARFLMALQIL